MTKHVNQGPLWLVTLAMSALLIGGTLISYDMAAAQMFGLLGGVSLPVVALLHNASGRDR